MPDDETFKMFITMLDAAYKAQSCRIDELTLAVRALSVQVGEVDKSREQLAMIAAADHALLTQHLFEAAAKQNGSGKKSFSLFGKLFGG